MGRADVSLPGRSPVKDEGDTKQWLEVETLLRFVYILPYTH